MENLLSVEIAIQKKTRMNGEEQTVYRQIKLKRYEKLSDPL